ncbi:hypothetical protein MPTK1_7g08760 [Marchantia polymorpha subsp. ruderalis]|uniref:Uncharacterized protein n=2 Tax=Marchantia polymorpha TaxID=3197 RepID=A0AAF6BXJ0_MARPO|nr:hypothetical protein MARPO_0068s0030 [Marchantia polymorpha]BBN16724.1 hypothetical protein Mp_7g08760 [Marchantia polymorpha subsp. ruderalis]|eukprot:PTQ35808.1 hypothetical protein MARPO_0068s0030 [Marchantia polymorpha]
MARLLLGLIGLAVVCLALQLQVHAATPPKDPSTDYVMLPQSTQGGPERAFCLSGPCKNQRLTCPQQCPKRSTQAPGKSACFIDCAACHTVCKHRKPNCYGFGAICYDPRFVGGDGVMFYFHGKKDQDFCIVSDRNLHINAHFIGKRPEGRSRDYTWVQGLGIMFDSHKLAIGAKKVGTWYDNIDEFTFSYDGVDFTIPHHDGAIWTSSDGQVVIERTSEANSAHVLINQLMELSVDVVPITAEESRVHNYQVTNEDRFAHLQMQFNFFGLSSTVHGVLGQTYQPNYRTTVNTNVPMPIMGGDEKYLSSSLLSTDCRVTQFSSEPSATSELPVIKMPIQCTSKEGGMSCRR